MDALSTDVAWWLLLVVSALVLLEMGRRSILKRWRLFLHHRRGRVARRGERDAVDLLRAAGYDVVDSQVYRDWIVRVDGEPREIRVIADHVVERGGERYVAEVKTGESAPSIETAATRRQLLEYRVAFDVAGVLLVDMRSGRVRTVEFFDG